MYILVEIKGSINRAEGRLNLQEFRDYLFNEKDQFGLKSSKLVNITKKEADKLTLEGK